MKRESGYAREMKEANSMPKYEVIIYWSEEDEAFIAGVPGLRPSAMAV